MRGLAGVQVPSLRGPGDPTPRLRPRSRADTLAWKLELIRQGCEHVGPLLPRVGQRCLILVGTRDLLIPSGSEGPRLGRLMPRARVRMLDGASHSALQEMSQGLGAVLEQEDFYVRRRRLSAPLESRASAGGRGEAAPVEIPCLAEIDRWVGGRQGGPRPSLRGGSAHLKVQARSMAPLVHPRVP